MMIAQMSGQQETIALGAKVVKPKGTHPSPHRQGELIISLRKYLPISGSEKSVCFSEASMRDKMCDQNALYSASLGNEAVASIQEIIRASSSWFFSREAPVALHLCRASALTLLFTSGLQA